MDIEQERKQYEEKKIARKLKDAIAPSVEQRRKRVDSFKSIAYYLVIGFVLIIVTFIVPLLSGGITMGDFGYNLPKTKEAWIVFWAVNIGTVFGNLCLFALFKMQAKTNSKHHPDYIKACELLNKLNGQEGFIPMSPRQKNIRDWSIKGTIVLLTTGLESVVISVLVVSFDMVTFISCLVSSVTAVLFGIVQMIKDEIYWTEEYLLYAEYVVKQRLAVESVENEPETIQTAQESNVSESTEELYQKDLKEAENA